jgi:germination protein M
MCRTVFAALLAALVATLACTPGASPEPAAATAAATIQPPGLVDLTVYFRAGSGTQAHLVPVTREVAVGDDLPRRALELLLAGPVEGDAQGLVAPLPTTTRVLGFDVDGDVADIDLSAEVVTDAGTVGRSPEHEALALAALADTLTEFPTIRRVRLRVEGQRTGAVNGTDVQTFWGGWGLPDELVRDESVIAPPAEDAAVPPLERFTRTAQAVGVAEAAPVQIAGVRAQPRTTYLRVVVELAGGADADRPPLVPLARAAVVGKSVVLDLERVLDYGPDAGAPGVVDLADPALQTVTIEPRELPGTVRIRVETPAPEFWLHTLSSPTRVVLDVKK